jgi:tetratricopeptide (TPR) repeat protein
VRLDREHPRLVANAVGKSGLALAAYQRLRAALADELGVDPAEQTRDLHRVILRDEPGGPVNSGGGAAAVPGPPSGDLVGREAELALLHRAWSQAAAGRAQLVLLLGEAGIGKTTLAGEVVRLVEATGGTVAQARCYEAERSLFLQPVADALRPIVTSSSPDLIRAAAGRLAGSLADLIAEVGEVAPAGDYLQASPEVERRRVFEAVAGFVRALAGRRPLLLFLDDLHLAGASTLELLHFLFRRLAGRPALVLATARVEEGTEVVHALGGIAQRCDLGPLAEPAVRELARRSGLNELTGQIMAQTRGHSLFVVESLRALATQPAGAGSPVVPESLRTAVVTRMRRAGPQVEELLRAAAVIGGSIDPAVLAGLTGEPVAQTALRAHTAAQARLLIEAGETYEFANDLIREIAYQSTSLPVRVTWHRRAAELLAGNPEAVAGHASRAGDWPAAVEAWLQAAEAAAGRFANREAERLLEQAMAAAVRGDDRVGLARARLARGRIREALADYQGAYEDHRAVVESARANGRTDLELAALNQLGGDMLVGLGRPTRECIPYLEGALSLAEAGGDVPGQIDILGRLAVIWTNRLRFDRAATYAERATALAGSSQGESGQVLALDAVKTTLAYRGEVAGLGAALPCLQTYLHRYEQHLYRYRRVQLAAWATFESAFPALAAGRWAEAAEQIARAGDHPRERIPGL